MFRFFDFHFVHLSLDYDIKRQLSRDNFQVIVNQLYIGVSCSK
jgi:hypothetical protein